MPDRDMPEPQQYGAGGVDHGGPMEAMRSEHQTFCGAAQGIGSVSYADPGAYDVVASTRARLYPGSPTGRQAEDLGGAPAPNVTGGPAAREAEEMRAQAAKAPSTDWHEL